MSMNFQIGVRSEKGYRKITYFGLKYGQGLEDGTAYPENITRPLPISILCRHLMLYLGNLERLKSEHFVHS